MKWLHSSKLHLALLLLWIVLAIPTVTIWRSSIAWVNIMSLYAIIVSHWGAMQAARAEEQVEKR